MSATQEAITMEEIERACLQYGGTHKELAQLAFEMDAAIQAAMRDGLPRLRRLIAKAHRDKQAVEMLVDAGRELFAKKRTVELHGIKVGLQKGRGGLRIPDPDRTCELIEKKFPDLYDVLVRTKKEPDKQALSTQPAGLLKAVGCDVAQTGDLVVVKPADGKTEKLVKELMAGRGTEAE